ncbi:hypothetical protein HMPREF1985_01690 [Mitsuokella sp. oral taxon 131 str. W9106]|nr:hypothetical protein HMPREF1985_01690 [Mitsuokella sp. oral taxon 131 str. W9106]
MQKGDLSTECTDEPVDIVDKPPFLLPFHHPFPLPFHGCCG